MNLDDLEPLQIHIDELEKHVPATGGFVQIIRGPDKGFVAIVGDRTGLIRLSLAILKYAVYGRRENSNSRGRSMVMDDFFAAASPTRDFMIQIDETDGQKRVPKPHSTFKLIANLLFKKK